MWKLPYRLTVLFRYHDSSSLELGGKIKIHQDFYPVVTIILLYFLVQFNASLKIAHSLVSTVGTLGIQTNCKYQ